MTIRPSLSGIYKGVRYRGESPVTVRRSMGDELRFNHPFSCLVSGPSGSGKSSFCIRFLQNLKALCTEPNFVWCHRESSANPSRQLVGKKHVRFHEGVPADLNNCKEKPVLIILDVLLNVAYSMYVCDLITKGGITGISVYF